MKVLMLLSDGFEEMEALAPADVLIRGGVEVEISSITGSTSLKGTHNIIINANSTIPETITDAQAADISGKYDAICLPGGQPNASNLQKDDRVIALVKAFYNAGKITSAICASPCVLERAGLLKDKKATSYPGCVDPANCKEYTDEKVVRDGLIITGKAAGTAIDFGLEILKGLGLENEAEKVEKQIFYK